jgi:hypothetical protein
MTPERKAEIEARLDAVLGISKPKPAKPKVVTSDGRSIRDAVVRVAPEDPNARGGDRVVEVRREDFVTINFELYELQQAEKAAHRRYLRELDPCRLGLYGSLDESEYD